MAKVIFEFDEFEDRQDVNMIVNRYKLVSTINNLSNWRRVLDKGWDGKENWTSDEIIKKIDEILEQVLVNIIEE